MPTTLRVVVAGMSLCRHRSACGLSRWSPVTTIRSTPTGLQHCWPASTSRSCMAWLSAAAQHVVTATDGKPVPPAKLVGWTARFLGMVKPGEEVEFRVDRVGIDLGAEVLEVAARVDNELVMSATARLAAPKTVYAFPQAGDPAQGHGHGGSGPLQGGTQDLGQGRQVHPRDARFSVLHVVRDNRPA